MTEIEKILDIARAEIGVAEDPIGSNNIKYNTAYYGRTVSGNAYQWCMVFVWWCFREAGLSHLFYGGGKTASCTALMRWAKAQGQFMAGGMYRAGDVFLYQFDDDAMADHTGIFTGQYDAKGRYLVIEGNHNNRVEIVSRTDAELWGAWRPAYKTEMEEDTSSGADENTPHQSAPSTVSPQGEARGIDLPEVRYGDMGSTVKAMQILLMGYGYKLPRYGADGEYGAETRTALKAFQKAKGLSTDGICGNDTWKALLGL